MISITVATHGSLGKGLVESASLLYSDAANIDVFGLCHGDSVDAFRMKIMESIERQGDNDGIIIFTDIFGGTPCNIIAKIINDHKELKITCFAGVNLPLFIQALTSRETHSYEELVHDLKEVAKTSIFDISDRLQF